MVSTGSRRKACSLGCHTGPQTQKGPEFCIMLCFDYLKFFLTFEQRASHVPFVPGPTCSFLPVQLR